jgi:parallel beta-helix repeat protein
MKKRKNIPIIISIITIFIFIAGCVEQQKPSNPYQSIQEMINNASNGDIINVNSGIYNENLIINKSIILKGDDRNTTVINGRGKNTIAIIADNCTVEGLTVTNNKETETTIGININANNTNIKNNVITFNSYGIGFNTSSKGNNIFFNDISNNTYGLYLTSSNENNITFNNVFSNIDKNIYLTHSHNNKINDNNISNSKYGISMVFSDNNSISNNEIHSNIQYGIYTGAKSANNTIKSNIIYKNQLGIRIKESNFNNVTKNIIKNNTEGVLICCNAKNNTIHRNIIKNNINWNAEGNLYNQWDFIGIGNYWDDYSGIDSNNDGIGDTPYTFIGGMDNYPLINETSINEP